MVRIVGKREKVTLRGEEDAAAAALVRGDGPGDGLGNAVRRR